MRNQNRLRTCSCLVCGKLHFPISTKEMQSHIAKARGPGLIFVFLLLVLQPVVDLATTQQNAMMGKISFYEQTLLSTLLANYSTSTRPATSTHKAVAVMFELMVNKIVRFDIREQFLEINALILLRWYDPQLAWNVSEWNNTNYLNIPYSSIWVPDIMLYNTALDDSKSPSDVYKTKVQVDYRGQASLASAVTLKASCSIDIKWFPFDSQSCTLTFGSQSYTRSRLDLTFRRQPNNTRAIRGNYHVDNGDWNITKVSSRRTENKYDFSPEPFAVIEYTLDLTRLYQYYLLYLVLPCLGLVILAPFMFYLPADSGERTGFGVTVVLALSVYLLVISDKLPEKSDKTPLIGALYIVLFFLLVVAMIFGIITTHLCLKTTKPPVWLWKLLFGRKREVKTIDTIKEKQLQEDGLVMTTFENNAHVRSRISKKPSAISAGAIAAINEVEVNQQKWKLITQKLDIILFVSYSVLVIFVPVVVCLSFL